MQIKYTLNVYLFLESIYYEYAKNKCYMGNINKITHYVYIKSYYCYFIRANWKIDY